MTSTEKKSYQYYFKKLQTPTSAKDLRRPDHLRTQSYVKYERFEKLNSSSFVPSSEKNIKNERSTEPCGLQKRGGLYSSVYTPGKYVPGRQYYASIDTEKKYTLKYITPVNGAFNLKGMEQVQQQSRVKQFSPGGEQNLQQRRFQQNQQKQSVTSENKQNGQISNLDKQQKNEAKIKNLSMQDSSRQFQSVDLRQTNDDQLTNFINSTLGNSIISYNNQHLVESKYEKQQLKSSLNKSQQRQDYLTEIEKFKQKLKREEMKLSTMFTIDQNSNIVDRNNVSDDNKSLMRAVHHVESRTFLSQSTIMSSKNLVECKRCQQLRNKLTQRQKQIQELYSKRHHTMEQVYKQHKLIKEHQEKQTKFKQQIQTKIQEINQKSTIISQLRNTIENQRNQQQRQIQQLNSINQQQIQTLQRQYDQKLTQQRQTISDYISCMDKLNKKIQQLDEKQQLTIKSCIEKYEKDIYLLEQKHKKQLERLSQGVKDQNKKMERAYDSKIQVMADQHQNQLNQIHQIHEKQTNKLKQQIADLTSYKNQLSQLTQIVVKLQSQILLQKNISVNLSQQNKTLQSLINQLQQQLSSLRLSSNEYERTIAMLQDQKVKNKQMFQNTLKEMSQKISQKQLKVQQLQEKNSLLLLKVKDYVDSNKKVQQLPEQQWLSISPSTSSIGRSIKVAIQRPMQAVTAFSLAEKQQKESQKEEKDKCQQLILRQKIVMLQSRMKQRQDQINESEQVIRQLNDKVIGLQKKLYPSEEHINVNNINNINNKNIHYQQQQQKMVELSQQLQSKQTQILQLQQQLKQSLQLITLLKDQLTLKQQPNSHGSNDNSNGHDQNQDENQNQNQNNYQENSQNKKHNNNNNKLSIQIHQLQQQQQQYYQQYQTNHNQSLSQHKKNKKQILLKQYFVKIEQFYNQVLEIFGLQFIHHQLLQLQNNLLSPMCTPRKRNPSVPKFLEDSQGASQLQAKSDQQAKQKEGERLTSFQQQQTQTEKVQKTQSQTVPYLPLPSPTKSSNLPPPHTNPLQQTFHFLSSNQQQVLRIINQWIRKLQRQSTTIHQYKQKCKFLQQQVTQLSEENNLLSLEKLQIYDKYQAFVVKLQAQNNQLQDKIHMMGGKILQLQSYIKELEDNIHQTNKQCIKNGLVSLELQKEHSSFGKLIYKSILMYSQEQNICHTQQKLQYFEEFYDKYDLSQINSQLHQSKQKLQSLSNSQKNISQEQNKSSGLSKSEATPENSQKKTPQNEQEFINQTKLQIQQQSQNLTQEQKKESIITS